MMSFDEVCRAAGRRILATMTAEERAVKELDFSEPADVCAYVAAALTFERQSFNVTVDDVEKRVRELAAEGA